MSKTLLPRPRLDKSPADDFRRRRISVVLYDRIDGSPSVQQWTLGRLEQRLTDHRDRTQKDGGNCFIPARVLVNNKTSDSNIAAITAFTLDIDDGTQPERVKEAFKGYLLYLHSTFSHTPQK